MFTFSWTKWASVLIWKMLPDWRPCTWIHPWYMRRLSRFSKSVIVLLSGLRCSWSLGRGPLLCSDRWRSPSPCQAAQTNRPAIWLTNLPLLSPLSSLQPLLASPANSHPSLPALASFRSLANLVTLELRENLLKSLPTWVPSPLRWTCAEFSPLI